MNDERLERELRAALLEDDPGRRAACGHASTLCRRRGPSAQARPVSARFRLLASAGQSPRWSWSAPRSSSGWALAGTSVGPAPSVLPSLCRSARRVPRRLLPRRVRRGCLPPRPWRVVACAGRSRSPFPTAPPSVPLPASTDSLFAVGRIPVAGGQDELAFWRSSDGTTWTLLASGGWPLLTLLCSPTSCHPEWARRMGLRQPGALPGAERGACGPAFLMSPDGVTWTRVADAPTFAGASIEALASGPHGLVAVGIRAGTTRRSGSQTPGRPGSGSPCRPPCLPTRTSSPCGRRRPATCSPAGQARCRCPSRAGRRPACRRWPPLVVFRRANLDEGDGGARGRDRLQPWHNLGRRRWHGCRREPRRRPGLRGVDVARRTDLDADRGGLLRGSGRLTGRPDAALVHDRRRRHPRRRGWRGRSARPTHVDLVRRHRVAAAAFSGGRTRFRCGRATRPALVRPRLRPSRTASWSSATRTARCRSRSGTSSRCRRSVPNIAGSRDLRHPRVRARGGSFETACGGPRFVDAAGCGQQPSGSPGRADRAPEPRCTVSVETSS